MQMHNKKVKIVAPPTTALEYIQQQIEYKQVHIRNEKQRLEILFSIEQELLSRTVYSTGKSTK